MKKIFIFAAALAGLLAGGAYAASPGLISYQGTLRKDGRLFSGTVSMEFSITDASGGTVYWNSGSTDVVVSTGLFRYPLGTPNEAAFAVIPWKDITPYVRMGLDGGWLPAEPLYSSVYSLHSVTAEASTGTFTVNNGDLKLAGAAGSRGVVYTDNTVQRTAPGWAASGQHAVLTGTGYAGLGLAGPQTRLDVQTAASDSYSQYWRNSGGVIVASMSAGGTLYADAAGLRNIAGDGLGSHTATQDLNMAGRRIVSAPSVGFNAAVSLSSASAGQYGGLYVSSNVYLAAGARYYGDGSGLSNVSGADDLGDHTLTQNLVLGANWVSGDGGGEGLAVDAAGNVGVGQAAPGARLDVRGDSGGYAQIWRDSGGVVQASMSATGVLYAAASGLRGLPAGALGDGLGSHTLAQNLAAGTFWYSGDGGNEGLFVDAGGNVGVSTNAPAARLDVRGAVAGNSQIWRSAAGTAVATMTAAGVLHADGSGLINIAEADPVFAAHPAYAIQAGERAAWNGAAAWGDHAAAGYARLAPANTFASSATFAVQHATLPGVLVSSGLVVANGSVGIGTALPQQRLDVNGAVRVGDSAAAVPGSIRYNGSSFEGYNGSAWVALNGSYINDNSALWAVGTDTVYTVGAASSVAIGYSTDAGNSKLLVRANTDDNTENAFLAENFTGFPLFKVRNDGNIGAGTVTPEARLDVLTVPGAQRSQIWRDQSNVIVASVSAGGIIYADGSGLRNIAGDGLGGHTASQALNLAGNQLLNVSSATVTGAQGVGAPRLALAPGVALSSATAAFRGGVYISTHVYLPAGAKYYGDGSALSNVGGNDNLGDHTLTQDLVTGSNWITGDGDPEGLYVDIAGNAGVGTSAPAARLDVLGDQGGYIQFWRNNGGVAQATMTAFGVLHADGSALRNLSASALTAGALPDARLSANVPLLGAAANTFTGSLSVTGAGGASASRFRLAPGVELSSSAPAFNGGVYVSSNIYVVGIASAAKYYGDGSELTGVGGLGDHTLTQNLLAGANWLSGDGGNEGVSINAAGNVGIGVNPATARLEVNDGDASALTSGVKFTDFGCSGFDKLTVDVGGNLVCAADQTGSGSGNLIDTLAQTLGAGANAGGLGMTGLGDVALGLDTAGTRLDVQAGAGGYAQFWRDNGGVIVASMTDAGVLYADASQLRNLPAGADGLGDHTLTQNLVAGANWLSGDGGNEGVSVNSAGNVGIGVNPATARLEVNDGDANALTSGVKFTNFACAGFNKLTVDVSGNLVCAADQTGGGSGNFIDTLSETLNAGANAGGLGMAGLGNVALGLDTAGTRLDVQAGAGGYTQFWRDNGGVIVASMTDAGILYADAAGLRNLPAGGGSDNLGNHTLTQNLVAGANWLSGDGGNEGVSINAAGNVGIGVNPATARLEVNDGDANALTSGVKFTNFACTGFNKLTVDVSGNLVCAADQTGGGSGNFIDTLSETLNAGANAGGLGMVGLGDVALGLDTAGTRLDVQAGAGGYTQFWRDNGGVIVASMTDAGILYADAAGLRNLPAGGGSDDLGNHTATMPLNLAGNWIVNVSTIVVSPSEPGITVSTSLFVGGAVGILGTMTGASLDVGPSAEGYVQFWRDPSGVVVATMTAAGVLYADGSQLRNLPGGGGAGTLSDVLTAGNNAGGRDIVGLGDITQAGNLTAYSSMTVNAALGVSGAVSVGGSLSAGGLLASTISASGYLALANLNSNPSGTGAGTLYYNPTAFSNKGALYLNLNGTFVPIATGTVAGGGGGGTLSGILSAGGDAGGFGMTNLSDVAIGAASAGARLDVQGGGGYIQIWRNSTGVIVASMTNTGTLYASNVAGGGGGGGALSCVNPNDPADILVQVGDFCVDKYEATVWSAATGGSRYGTASDNYPCADDGQNCASGPGNSIYARSVSGQTPSAYITWFQAAAACANGGKHLITNAEWQAAVMGTPSASCNTAGGPTGSPNQTGVNGGCLSSFLAENMVGSLWEMVGDLGMYTPNGGGGTWDNGQMASGPSSGPLSMTARGGSFYTDPISLAPSGPLSFFMGQIPTFSDATLGFRCAMQMK